MKDKDKTTEIIKRLLKHETQRDNLCVVEVPFSAGYGLNSRNRADLIAFTVGKRPEVTCYEIKVSRGDFLKDVKSLEKQILARSFCNYFYYVCPEGLIKAEEIPTWAGLIEIDLDSPIVEERYSNNFGIAWAKQPVYMETVPPTWGLLVSILRRKEVFFREVGRSSSEYQKKVNEYFDPKGEDKHTLL